MFCPFMWGGGTTPSFFSLSRQTCQHRQSVSSLCRCLSCSRTSLLPKKAFSPPHLVVPHDTGGQTGVNSWFSTSSLGAQRLTHYFTEVRGSVTRSNAHTRMLKAYIRAHPHSYTHTHTPALSCISGDNSSLSDRSCASYFSPHFYILYEHMLKKIILITIGETTV